MDNPARNDSKKSESSWHPFLSNPTKCVSGRKRNFTPTVMSRWRRIFIRRRLPFGVRSWRSGSPLGPSNCFTGRTGWPYMSASPSTSGDAMPQTGFTCPRPRRPFLNISPNGFGKKRNGSVRKRSPWWNVCSLWGTIPCAISGGSRDFSVLPGRFRPTVWNRRSGLVSSSGNSSRTAAPLRG